MPRCEHGDIARAAGHSAQYSLYTENSVSLMDLIFLHEPVSARQIVQDIDRFQFDLDLHIRMVWRLRSIHRQSHYSNTSTQWQWSVGWGIQSRGSLAFKIRVLCTYLLHGYVLLRNPSVDLAEGFMQGSASHRYSDRRNDTATGLRGLGQRCFMV